MKTLCEKMDQDIVLLVHGELPGRLGIPVRAHLLSCARCRARKRQMEALTRSLATALKNPILGSRSFRHHPGLIWTSIGAGVLVLLVSGLLVANAFSSAEIRSSANGPLSCPLHGHAIPRSSAGGPLVGPPNAKPKIDAAKPVMAHCAIRAM